MRVVRFWIGAFLMIAVIAASFPSSAMTPHDGAKHPTQSAGSSGSHDNHNSHPQSKAGHGKHACCEKQKSKADPECNDGRCKCVDGSCHGASVKILGGASLPLPRLPLAGNMYEYSDVVLTSAIADRLKRPPRA